MKWRKQRQRQRRERRENETVDEELQRWVVHLQSDIPFAELPKRWHWSTGERLRRPVVVPSFISTEETGKRDVRLEDRFNNFIKSSIHPRSSFSTLITKTKTKHSEKRKTTIDERPNLKQIFEGQSTGSFEQLFSSPVQHWIESNVSIQSTRIKIFSFESSSSSLTECEKKDHSLPINQHSTTPKNESLLASTNKDKDKSLGELRLPAKEKKHNLLLLLLLLSVEQTKDEFRSSPLLNEKNKKNVKNNSFFFSVCLLVGRRMSRRGGIIDISRLLSQRCKSELERTDLSLSSSSLNHWTHFGWDTTNESRLAKKWRLNDLSLYPSSFTSNRQEDLPRLSFFLWSFLVSRSLLERIC